MNTNIITQVPGYPVREPQEPQPFSSLAGSMSYKAVA